MRRGGGLDEAGGGLEDEAGGGLLVQPLPGMVAAVSSMPAWQSPGTVRAGEGAGCGVGWGEGRKRFSQCTGIDWMQQGTRTCTWTLHVHYHSPCLDPHTHHTHCPELARTRPHSHAACTRAPCDVK